MSFAKRHAFWIAPLLGFVGFVSYFLVFAKWPATRDFPWVNLPVVLAAVALGFAGLGNAWKTGRWRTKLLHFGGSCAALALAGLLCFYVFSFSATMPEATEEAVAMDMAPNLSLPDARGETVTLESFRGGPVLLLFYRGFW